MVLAKGATEAGAIFIQVTDRERNCSLYGPAPQSAFGDDQGDRKFEIMLTRTTGDEVEARIEKEKNFDPDLWLIEVEDALGRSFLEE